MSYRELLEQLDIIRDELVEIPALKSKLGHYKEFYILAKDIIKGISSISEKVYDMQQLIKEYEEE